MYVHVRISAKLSYMHRAIPVDHIVAGITHTYTCTCTYNIYMYMCTCIHTQPCKYRVDLLQVKKIHMHP